MNPIDIKQTARAPIVLVNEENDSFVTSVIVRAILDYGADRVRFKGVSAFTEEVQTHIQDTIVPIVDDIAIPLGLEQIGYEISVANLSAASAKDRHIKVEGFSADLPVFTAMLSVALDLPFSSDILSTGHIGSSYGEILPVKSLDVKLKAAEKDYNIKRFICPIHERNDNDLCVEKKDTIFSLKDGLATKKQIQVANICDYIKKVVEPYQIILSSLKKDYFENASKRDFRNKHLAEIISCLTDDNPRRFWLEFQRLLMLRQNDTAKELLTEYCGYYGRKRKYPMNVGKRLSTTIAAVPSHLRQCDELYPLCDLRCCIRSGQYAGADDYYDYICFLNFVAGISRINCTIPKRESLSLQDDVETNLFDEVINKLGQKGLADRIDIPIDSAYSSFVVEKSVVSSYSELIELVTSFYIHLRCHVDQTDLRAIDPDMCKNEALSLLEKAFKDYGGSQGAYVKASEGIDSGIRGVLNRLVETFKHEQKTKYVNRVIKDVVDVMSWHQRVDFMRMALRRIGNLLPQELRQQPPERFARDFEMITKAIIQSLDKMNNVFAAL